MEFTKEELQNIGILINKANITGAEATTVAMLLQKITKLIQTQKPEVEKSIKENNV